MLYLDMRAQALFSKLAAKLQKSKLGTALVFLFSLAVIAENAIPMRQLIAKTSSR